LIADAHQDLVGLYLLPHVITPLSGRGWEGGEEPLGPS
jgi:hypothetical protein